MPNARKHSQGTRLAGTAHDAWISHAGGHGSDGWAANVSGQIAAKLDNASSSPMTSPGDWVDDPNHERLLHLFFTQGIDGFFFMMLDQPLDWQGAADPAAALDYAFTHQRLTKANAAFFDQYLAQASDFLGRSFAEFFRHDPAAGRAILEQLFNNGYTHLETEEQRLDGSCIFVEGDYLCLYDDQGRITGHFGVQRDITDLKQAVTALQASEQRLREQEAHLSMALEAAQMGIWEWHIPTGKVIWSESLEKQMGLAPGSFQGTLVAFQQMIHPEDRQRVLATLDQGLGGQADYTIEFRLVRADGSVRWGLSQGAVEHDELGNPVFMRGVDIDITARKEAELKLQESETRFHNVSSNLPGAIFRYVLHPDGTDSVTYMNQGCLDLWEIESAAVIENAQPLWDMVHPEDREQIWQLVQESGQTLQPWFCEWRITTPSGRLKWFQGIGQPECLANGDIAWDTLILDRSTSKRTELALCQTTAQLESFIDNAPALVTMIDGRGRYIKVNQAVADQFHQPTDAMIGQPIAQFIPAEVVDTFMARIRQVITTQTPLTVADSLALPAGNRVFRTVLFPIAHADPAGTGAVGSIATDITPLVEAQLTSRRQVEEERLLRTITQHIHQSLDIHEILQTAVTEVRQFLQTDRVLVYRFNPDLSGTMVVEAVLPEWQSTLGTTIEDTCFMTDPALAERYRQGHTSTINDIHQAPLDPCHRDLLTRWQVQANLVIPINYDDKLWGLLCVHHCRAPRQWQAREISLVKQLADQLAIALFQGQLLAQTALLAQQEKLLNDIVTTISDSLDIEELLQRAADEMLQVFQASRSLVILCQPTDRVLVHTTTAVAPGITDVRGDVVPIADNPHAQRILAQADPVAVDDVTQDPLLQSMRPLAQAFNLGAMLAVSIRYRGQVKGILSLQQCHGPRVWSLAEQRLIKRVADQLAIGLQQAELYQQAQVELAERKRLEAKLRHDAFHDQLTDLPNRALFLERLSAAIDQLHSDAPDALACPFPYNPGQPMASNCQFAVLFLDLDRFKVINDSLGHSIGDFLLQTVAQRLLTCLRPMDTAARLGGDEFVILLTNLSDPQVAVNLARRIHTVLEAPIWLDGYEVFVHASIGIALSFPAYTDPNHVLRDADIAMYQAKASNREYAIFDTPMHALAVQQMQIENDLRRAIERQEFVLYYQPIIDLKTFKIQGFEALMRWQHPHWGLVSPMTFIPVAENTGLIATLDLWALNQACQQIREWQRQYPQLGLFVNVNLSGKQFMRPDLIAQIDRALAIHDLSGYGLKIEITESVLIQNSQTAIELLRQLRQRHIQVCMDDFGTGYSSLSYLHRFPIDVLKIDKSFIGSLQGEGQGQDNYEIVRAILNLANGLNLTVVAEGVETLDQVKYLQTHHCHSGQGYFFSKPINVAEAQVFLAQPSPPSA